MPHFKKAWVVTVDMGYGHQRATYPLKDLAYGEIIDANSYSGIPKKDKEIWESTEDLYNFISQFKKVPIVGEATFDFFNLFQRIKKFYPRRDLSRPSMQLKQIYSMIKKNNWGKHLIDKLAQKPLPLITSFFTVAYMAEYYNYPYDIYLVICDADISRAWAPLDPRQSKIKYLAPTQRVVERLRLYGVRSENIFLTGFPLPKESVGDRSLDTLRRDLKRRIAKLDPTRIYINNYQKTLKTWLGVKRLPAPDKKPLTIGFAVGGAGAQREIGVAIARSLRKEIINKRIKLILVAGSRQEIFTYYKKELTKLKLERLVKIIFTKSKIEYLGEFNRMLHVLDVLWTKPSELSFYSALGLPIIIAPPVGSQEDFNRDYLKHIGSGIDQEDPEFVNEWLFDWLNSGWLAEAAMQGFSEGNKLGSYNIEKIIQGK